MSRKCHTATQKFAYSYLNFKNSHVGHGNWQASYHSHGNTIYFDLWKTPNALFVSTTHDPPFSSSHFVFGIHLITISQSSYSSHPSSFPSYSIPIVYNTLCLKVCVCRQHFAAKSLDIITTNIKASYENGNIHVYSYASRFYFKRQWIWRPTERKRNVQCEIVISRRPVRNAEGIAVAWITRRMSHDCPQETRESFDLILGWLISSHQWRQLNKWERKLYCTL
jgi:hypothetical protein